MAKAPTTNEFRHPIQLQARTVSVTDTYGQRNLLWAPVRSTWAKLEVKQAAEVVDGNRKVQISKFIFTVRMAQDVNPSMRISYRDVIYSIDAVYDKDGLGKYLTIEATLDASNTTGSV